MPRRTHYEEIARGGRARAAARSGAAPSLGGNREDFLQKIQGPYRECTAMVREYRAVVGLRQSPRLDDGLAQENQRRGRVLVDPIRIELTTFSLRTRRSPN
jgi:hypothetical protein